MKRAKKKLRYFSCLLRLWQTEDNQDIIWRASLEFPVSGERLGFGSLAELYAYLQEETAIDEPETVEDDLLA
jgi:hypothetical protein